MSRLPDLLPLLSRDELLAAADRLGVTLPERRAKDPIVEALAAAPAATADAVLADLKRDRLKELCRAIDLDNSGREKAEITARPAGGPSKTQSLPSRYSSSPLGHPVSAGQALAANRRFMARIGASTPG